MPNTDWLREMLAKEGWGMIQEWSAPGPLGQTYSLTNGKWDVRLQEQQISAFISGLRYGKMQAEKDAGIV